MKLHPAYRLSEEPPTVEEYRALRVAAGLTPVRAEQAEPALHNSWTWVTVRTWASDELAGMGRVLGDGGWYFTVADTATHPAHRRRGIGRAVLSHLVERIDSHAPVGAYITLLADEPARRLYTALGFEPTGPGTIGMRRAGWGGLTSVTTPATPTA